MPRLFVICGHGAGDPGAGGYGFDEAERVRVLGNRIKELGGDNVILGDTSRNYYADSGILSGDIPGDSTIVELHMDSAVASARGGHVLVKTGIGTNQYDENLANFITDMFPGRANKFQYVDWLANANRAYSVGLDYRLLECCFISNYDDLEKFNSNIDAVAEGILAAFDISSNSNVAPAPEPTPANPDVEPDDNGGCSEFEGGVYICQVDGLNVRVQPTVNSVSVAQYNSGQSVVLDDWYTIADGYVWGRYIGASSGEYRYVAVGKATGKPESDDYLIKE